MNSPYLPCDCASCVFVFGVLTVLSTSAAQSNPWQSIHCNKHKNLVMIAAVIARTMNLAFIRRNYFKGNRWEGFVTSILFFCFLTMYTCATLQNCSCHQHEWDQQQVPRCFHHRLHTKETWQRNRPLHRKGQRRQHRWPTFDSHTYIYAYIHTYTHTTYWVWSFSFWSRCLLRSS